MVEVVCLSRLAAHPIEGSSPQADHPLEIFIRSQLGIVFPAGVLLVQRAGELLWHQAYGFLDPQGRHFQTQVDSLFDLASLTKLFTATAFMRLVERGLVSLDTSVGEVLPGLRGKRWIGAAEDPLKNLRLDPDACHIGAHVDLEQVSFRRLLTHSSGLAAWRSVYAVGGGAAPIPMPHEVPAELRRQRLDEVYQYDFFYPPGERVVYSDLGFILLGEAIQTLSGMPLEAALNQEVIQPLGLATTGYNLLAYGIPPERFAPAEVCAWRHRRLVGEVDDENAASLGGVTGHAGLFATAQDVARLGQMYLQEGSLQGTRLLAPETVAEMTSEQAAWGGLRRGLAFVLPTPKDCSCGVRFSQNSFGHTGFTGTSLWVDPQRSLVVVALTNRVYYGRGSDAIQAFRPALHDLIIETLLDD
jgi:CubicO group peptidase (beta-lactamase class C family)